MIIKIFSILLFSSFLYSTDIDISKAPYYYVIDAQNSVVLAQKNAEEKIYPASITKLMTLYITFTMLENGMINLKTETKVSKNAYNKGNYKTGSSTMFLREGQTVSVENLIHGIATLSGNDASITIAELIAGTEKDFVEEMNAQANRLGLLKTHFTNVDGWHDINHYSTTKDLTILSYFLYKDFPQYYNVLSVRGFSFNGITQQNRNLLLDASFGDKDIIVDGLKTGYTDFSKHSLAFGAIDLSQNFRIIGVIGGLETTNSRLIETRKLINWVYDNYRNIILFKQGEEIIKIPIYNSHSQYVPIFASSEISYILPKDINASKTKVMISHTNFLKAPISIRDGLATITITPLDKKYTKEYKILATQEVKQNSVIKNIIFAPYNALRKLL